MGDGRPESIRGSYKRKNGGALMLRTEMEGEFPEVSISLLASQSVLFFSTLLEQE